MKNRRIIYRLRPAVPADEKFFKFCLNLTIFKVNFCVTCGRLAAYCVSPPPMGGGCPPIYDLLWQSISIIQAAFKASRNTHLFKGTPHLNDQIPVYCFPSTASFNPLPRDENNSKSFEINPPENDGTQEFQLQNNSGSVRITDSPAHSSFVTKSPVSKPPPLPPRNSTSPRSKISPKAKNEVYNFVSVI